MSVNLGKPLRLRNDSGAQLELERGGIVRTLTVNASGVLVMDGTQNLAIVGGSINGTPIGGTTASTGAFSNLSYTGTLTGGTGVVNLGSGQLVKDASGNVGIGTASPSAALDVQGGNVTVGSTTTGRNLSIFSSSAGNNGLLRFFDTGNTERLQIAATTDTAVYFAPTGTNHAWFVGTERMRIDSAGNVGIGVTPSAWTSTWRALQLGGGSGNAGSVYVNAGGTTGQIGIAQNWFFDGSANKYITTAAASDYFQFGGTHVWRTAPSGTAGNTITFEERMRIDSAGRVGLNGTPTGTGVDTGNTRLYVVSPNDNLGPTATFITDGVGRGVVIANQDKNIIGAFSIASEAFRVATNTNTPLMFLTNGTERMRITAAGYLKAAPDGTFLSSTGPFYELNGLDSLESVLYVVARNASYQGNSISSNSVRNTTNNSFYHYAGVTAGTVRFRVADSGDVTNTNGTYGTISDIKHKQDVTDASSQWDDIKRIKFRKYRLKSDVDVNPDAPYMLGVVAQELEEISPGLVEEHVDYEEQKVTEEDGNVTTQRVRVGSSKSVKSSILLMKAAVALQEAMARIEQLESRIAQLENTT
jgi:hypothetical protein